MSSQPNSPGPAAGQPLQWPLILATDAEGHVTGASDGLCRQLGRSARALALQPHAALLHPVQPPRPAMALAAALRGGQPWCGPLAYRDGENQPCWLQVHAMPLRHGDQVAGYLLLHGLPVAPGRPQVWRLAPAWRLRLGVAGLAALAMASGERGGLVGGALLGHLGVCALGAVALLVWLQLQVLRPWQQAQRQAQALAAGQPLAAAEAADAEPLSRAMHQAALHLQALVAEVGPQVDGLRTASQALALQVDDLGQRIELAAAALQETATTAAQLHTALPLEAGPAEALCTVCEAMDRLDDSLQQQAARTDACKTAAAALAQRAARLAASWRLFRPEPPR